MKPVALALLLCLSGATAAADWPTGLSFIGLERDQWKIFVVTPGDSTPRALSSATEPHTVAYQSMGHRVAYVGADGTLREVDLKSGKERVVLVSDGERSWTQPTYDTSGRLYAVLLKRGNSADTDIVRSGENGWETVVPQRSAQFEPHSAGSTLYYSSVQCTVGCGNIIQDIWRKDLVTDQARQLTRMNAIAREPAPTPDGQWIYFVSDRAGHYHIWRVSSQGGEAEPITDGSVTDLSPAVDDAGRLWFIRRTPQSISLMVRGPDNKLRAVPLPKGVRDLRALEISR